MKYLKKFENFSFNDEKILKDLGWEFINEINEDDRYVFIKSVGGGEFINVYMHIEDRTPHIYFEYNYEYAGYQSLMIKTNPNLDNTIKYLNSIEDYVYLTPQIGILEDNKVELPDMDDDFYCYVENLNIYNEDVKKLKLEYDYLFTGKDMGLL